MGKHPRKKQKTLKEAAAVQPLGAKNPNVDLLTDDANKDDEERRLESMLFGTKFVPRDAEGIAEEERSEDDEDEWGGQEMGNLMDADVSFFLIARIMVSKSTSFSYSSSTMGPHRRTLGRTMKRQTTPPTNPQIPNLKENPPPLGRVLHLLGQNLNRKSLL